MRHTKFLCHAFLHERFLDEAAVLERYATRSENARSTLSLRVRNSYVFLCAMPRRPMRFRDWTKGSTPANRNAIRTSRFLAAAHLRNNPAPPPHLHVAHELSQGRAVFEL